MPANDDHGDLSRRWRETVRFARARPELGPARPPLPPPMPAGYVRLLPGRGEVFYRHHDHGEPGAPALLLLHGWTASSDLQWFACYQQLAQRYPFVAIDHRGHGRGMRSDEPFSLETAADDAAALVRELGLGPVIPVGYSMGGPISLLFAQRHPDLTSAVVLAATALEWRASARERLTWRFLRFTRVLMSSPRARKAMHRGLAGLVQEESPELAPYLPWFSAEYRRGDVEAMLEAGRALGEYDFRPHAETLQVPASYVLTTEDTLVKPSKQRALARALRAEVFPVDGDHLAPFIKGRAFSAVLRAAVDNVAARIPAARAA